MLLASQTIFKSARRNVMYMPVIVNVFLYVVRVEHYEYSQFDLWCASVVY